MTTGVKKPYDAIKAHEYYMKHRKLKGRKRKAAAKITGGKLKSRKNKKKQRNMVTKALYLTTGNKNSGKAVHLKGTQADYDAIKAKLAQINSKTSQLSTKQKQAVKRALISVKRQLAKG